MNKIYLMRDEKRNHALFKVGFTKDLDNRFYFYTTHNPEVECISYVNTKESSDRRVEEQFHKEIIARGYKMVTAVIDGKKTEWFKVEYTDPFFDELCERGLNAFKCGKNRKNFGCYVLTK